VSGTAADRADDEARWSDGLARAQAGDGEAYGQLLAELAGVIRAYLISRFGKLDGLDDCVQECLLALHQARHTYEPGRPFRPWLFAIVRNRTIDQLRRAPRETSLPPDHASAEAAPDESPEPGDAIDTGKLLGRLSHNLRETLILTKIMGYSTRECARRQGVSESVVKVRVHRGLAKLRALREV
jgi:RNA polymerase sigma-70 factor (ECF subfamily)